MAPNKVFFLRIQIDSFDQFNREKFSIIAPNPPISYKTVMNINDLLPKELPYHQVSKTLKVLQKILKYFQSTIFEIKSYKMVRNLSKFHKFVYDFAKYMSKIEGLKVSKIRKHVEKFKM